MVTGVEEAFQMKWELREVTGLVGQVKHKSTAGVWVCGWQITHQVSDIRFTLFREGQKATEECVCV